MIILTILHRLHISRVNFMLKAYITEIVCSISNYYKIFLHNDKKQHKHIISHRFVCGGDTLVFVEQCLFLTFDLP